MGWSFIGRKQRHTRTTAVIGRHRISFRKLTYYEAAIFAAWTLVLVEPVIPHREDRATDGIDVAVKRYFWKGRLGGLVAEETSLQRDSAIETDRRRGRTGTVVEQ
jgi:hypothetical protein